MFDFLTAIPVFGGTLSFIVPFVIVLSIVVFIHEYGHYIVARWCGIEAETFSVGFGPVIWSRVDKQGTKWQVALIPLGGYVKFLGDLDAASTQGRSNLAQLDPKEASRRFFTAPLYKRALTVFAGPAANFLLSIAVFAGLVMYTGRAADNNVVGDIKYYGSEQITLEVGDRLVSIEGQEIEDFSSIYTYAIAADATELSAYVVERDGQLLDVIGPYPTPPLVFGVEPVSPASAAGLQEDDLILEINGQKINSFEELRLGIRNGPEGAMPIKILRDGEVLILQIEPELRDRPTAEGFERIVFLGVYGGMTIAPETYTPNPLSAVLFGIERTYRVISGSLDGIYHILVGSVGLENLQGPIGIAQVSGETASMGLVNFISLIAVISTAIGLINLFPIPVLDGGHLVLFALEGIMRRPVNERYVRVATMMGLSLLMTLMVFATFNDLLRL